MMIKDVKNIIPFISRWHKRCIYVMSCYRHMYLILQRFPIFLNKLDAYKAYLVLLMQFQIPVFVHFLLGIVIFFSRVRNFERHPMLILSQLFQTWQRNSSLSFAVTFGICGMLGAKRACHPYFTQLMPIWLSTDYFFLIFLYVSVFFK